MAKLPDPVVKSDVPLEVREQLEEITQLWNRGRYTPAGGTEAPTFTGEDREMRIVETGGLTYLYIYSEENAAWRRVQLS